MEEKIIELRIHLPAFRINRRIWKWGLACGFLLLFVASTETEQITLTTYYPAPAGAYNNMVTIGNTWLARDPQPNGYPSYVELGSNGPVGTSTKLAVTNGSVGIGTTFPAGTLDVEYPGVGPGNVILNSGNVGIGTTSPGTTLDVNGYGYFGGRAVGIGLNSAPACNGNSVISMAGSRIWDGCNGNMYLQPGGGGGADVVINSWLYLQCNWVGFDYWTGWIGCPNGSQRVITQNYTWAWQGFGTSSPLPGSSVNGLGYNTAGSMLCCNIQP